MIIIKVLKVDKSLFLNSWIFVFVISVGGLCVSLFGCTFFSEIKIAGSFIL